MAVHLFIILFILTGLTGIYSITTVSKVSVETGSSIKIPCLYESQYKSKVKYLCKGYYWTSCSCAIKTNQTKPKFSISDDKSQMIFTVTIKDLIDTDTGYYWCAVEINGGSDARQSFHLSVSRGPPSLSVSHQEVKGFNGGMLTVSGQSHTSGKMKWCKLGSSCATEPSGSIDGATVTISATVHNVFTVTMSRLTIESSGWYWCDKGDLQIPVHVTITERPTSTTHATTTRLTTLSPTPKPLNFTTFVVNQAPTTVQSEPHSTSADLKSLIIIPLSVLICIVTLTLFLCFLLKKHKQNKVAAEPTRTEADDQVIYSIVKHSRKSSNQGNTGNDVDVIYSSVVKTKHQHVPRQVDINEENATYSNLA